MPVSEEALAISLKNNAFWNTLCGSQLATSLGIVDSSPASLTKFDTFYFDFYPYLLKWVNLPALKGKKVLEVGLGYGSLSQKIAEAGAEYFGLDIATGPVEMVNHRMQALNLNFKAQEGSILDTPFADHEFDCIITVGCLHHTGDLAQAINECYRILKPGGTLLFMIYNKYSFRRIVKEPKDCIISWFKEVLSIDKEPLNLNAEGRKDYDADLEGNAAPETVLTSICKVKELCSRFQSVKVSKENWDGQMGLKRTILLNTVSKLFGLDLYVTCRK